MMRSLFSVGALIVLSGCATQPVMDLSAFEAAGPRSLLVLPVVNNSLDVTAPDYMLSTLPVPLAEKGYYVFPVNTIKMILEQEGFYEPEQVHEQAPDALAALFDADAILYLTINRWDAQYALVTTTVTVDFDYRIVGRDGAELWAANQAMVYQPDNQSSGNFLADMVAAAVSAALTRAAPNYIPLARQANQRTFVSGPSALPDGPYKRVP